LREKAAAFDPGRHMQRGVGRAHVQVYLCT
jgi:hypothetical protein